MIPDILTEFAYELGEIIGVESALTLVGFAGAILLIFLYGFK